MIFLKISPKFYFWSALSDEFIDKLFEAADGNNDGTIDFDEFIKIVTKMIANDFTDILG